MMSHQKLSHTIVWVALGMVLLLGCSTAPVATPARVPTSTSVPDRPTPTLPPTKTATSTALPTDTPPPTPILGPERQAKSPQEIVGDWFVRVVVNLNTREVVPTVLTFKPDGTYDWVAVGGSVEGMTADRGNFSFEDGLLKLDTERGCEKFSGTFFYCVGTYEAYVAMGENGPGKLRFVMVQDEYLDRKKSLDGKTFLPTSEE